RDFLNFRLYRLADDGAFTRVNEDLIQDVSVNPDATVATYLRFFTSQSESSLYQVNLADPEALPTDFALIYESGIYTIVDPQATRDGNKIVFIGRDINEEHSGVYMVDLTTNEMVVISRDDAQYRQPTISSDGSYIAAVREDETGRVDLILFDMTQALTETGFVTVDLTIDGEAIEEAYPRFSADATLLAYSAAASVTPDNHEIFIIGLANGQPAPGNVPVATAPYDEIRPVFSPDGNYLAYSAKLTEGYNILIRDLSGTGVYQLSEDEYSVFAGDWIN
ncbi:MAG: PD40 domain-containing protein, partial [Anaerolineae bacterium]|nr:PD40 domain-containing protein [Anaerolineae bacterium]